MTPGDWFVDKDYDGNTVINSAEGPDTHLVAVLEDSDDGPLIAAAPDLLECLESCLSWLTSYPGGCAESAYDRARAVIGKAKGIPS